MLKNNYQTIVRYHIFWGKSTFTHQSNYLSNLLRIDLLGPCPRCNVRRNKEAAVRDPDEALQKFRVCFASNSILVDYQYDVIEDLGPPNRNNPRSAGKSHLPYSLYITVAFL